MEKGFLGLPASVINDNEKAKAKDVVKNPVLWAVSLGLWMLTTMGMMTLTIIGVFKATGDIGIGIALFYNLAYIVAAFGLGLSIKYLSDKWSYKISYVTSLIPFALIAAGSLVLMAFGGVLIGIIYIFSVIGTIALIIPYSAGYLVGNSIEDKTQEKTRLYDIPPPPPPESVFTYEKGFSVTEEETKDYTAEPLLDEDEEDSVKIEEEFSEDTVDLEEISETTVDEDFSKNVSKVEQREKEEAEDSETTNKEESVEEVTEETVDTKEEVDKTDVYEESTSSTREDEEEFDIEEEEFELEEGPSDRDSDSFKSVLKTIEKSDSLSVSELVKSIRS